MAPRQKLPKKKFRQRNANRPAAKQAGTLPPDTSKVVTNAPKRDTISSYDFFGFPASVFTTDLKRTGWATLVILALLGVITVIARTV